MMIKCTWQKIVFNFKVVSIIAAMIASVVLLISAIFCIGCALIISVIGYKIIDTLVEK